MCPKLKSLSLLSICVHPITDSSWKMSPGPSGTQARALRLSVDSIRSLLTFPPSPSPICYSSKMDLRSFIQCFHLSPSPIIASLYLRSNTLTSFRASCFIPIPCPPFSIHSLLNSQSCLLKTHWIVSLLRSYPSVVSHYVQDKLQSLPRDSQSSDQSSPCLPPQPHGPQFFILSFTLHCSFIDPF